MALSKNAEIVRRGYEAFNRGDHERMIADIAPAFEYTGTGAVPGFGGVSQGAGGWAEAVSWLQDEFDHPRVEVRELIEREDQVLAGVTLHGRGKQSGADTSWEIWNLWTIHDGKIVLGRGIRTREQGLKALGA
jgi:ketosteroid isomerase-like protein